MSQCQASAKREPVQPPVMDFVKPEESYTSKILGFSGKIGAGKDTLSNFIVGLALTHVLKITNEFSISPSGRLVIRVEDDMVEFDMESRSRENVTFMASNVWPFIKVYSFATPLKEFCNTILGVEEKCLWGTQEEKNEYTHLKWEDMPTKVEIESAEEDSEKKQTKKTILKDYRTGFMTGREVMEYFGTNVIRKMYGDAWAKGLMRIIRRENPVLAIIKDVRFINEVDSIEEEGGSTIRLNRLTDDGKNNTHISNTQLDHYPFKHILGNNSMNMEESFDALAGKMVELGWFSVEQQ